VFVRASGICARGWGLAVTVAVLVSGCVQPTARPLLWEIEGTRPSYLYGTIHLPDERVLALPPVVERALEAADAYYGELLLNRAAEDAVAARMDLPEGQTLHDVLPSDLYNRTDRYLQARGLRLAPLDRKQIWVIATSLVAIDYVWDLLLRKPLDLKLRDLAVWHGKALGGLETVDEQVTVFESLTPEEQVHVLELTLGRLEEAERSGTNPAREMVTVYLEGDEQGVLQVLLADFDPEDEVSRKLFDQLVTQRNARMTDRIARGLRRQPTVSFFFAVGAAHLVGEDGLIAQLTARGFKLRRLTPEDAAWSLPADNASGEETRPSRRLGSQGAGSSLYQPAGACLPLMCAERAAREQAKRSDSRVERARVPDPVKAIAGERLPSSRTDRGPQRARR